MNYYDFYLTTLNKLLAQGILSKTMKILVICGGPSDKETLMQAGFKDVTISNVDTRRVAKEYEPLEWCFQDSENLSFQDETFDFGIVHNGLHHCISPHKGLLELFRVSKNGVLVFEPQDNPLVRLGVKLGLGQEYEVSAVAHNNCLYGGVRNTPIPNYVYRWTKQEVIQTVNCYAPQGIHKYIFMSELRVPWGRLKGLSKRNMELAVRFSEPFLKVLSKVFPWFNNHFAFVVLKARIPEDIQPWLKETSGKIDIDREWVKAHYADAE